MAAQTFATADIPHRIAMLEDALEKVLDRDPEMSVELHSPGEAMHVYVIASTCCGDGTRTSHSLHAIAREMEALLP